MYKKLDKYKFVIITMFITFIIGFNPVYAANFTSIENSSKTNKLILIDPGHGGIDGGAVSKRGTIEKNINLSIGLKFKEDLEKKGFKVIMTRDTDSGLYQNEGTVREKKVRDLNNRCKLKKDSHCDMFISIHLNMFPQRQYKGAQVWYSNNLESKNFSKIMQQTLINNLDNNNKRVEKPAKGAYKVLKCNDNIPSVIVECGFLSNPTEEENLKTEVYQQKIADSLSESVTIYFDNIIKE